MAEGILEILKKLMKRVEVLERSSLGRIVLPRSSSAPSSPTQGEMYFDTSTNKSRTWDGSAWQNHY